LVFSIARVRVGDYAKKEEQPKELKKSISTICIPLGTMDSKAIAHIQYAIVSNL
jgi:hypothetical protein